MILLVSAILIVTDLPSTHTNNESHPVSKAPTRLTTSENFVVRSARPNDLQPVVKSAEAWRAHLGKKWTTREPGLEWRPRCEIVIHPTRASYLANVGRGGTQTFGSSLIRFENGQVAERRVDLLLDNTGKLSALPHELTHVVLADRFGGKQPPPWADEGIATLSDSSEKRALHHRDCCNCIDSGTAFRVHDLLTLTRVNDPEQMATFYGQSLSLASFLVQRDNSQQLTRFVERAMQAGYDQSLKEHYGIHGIAELEKLWRNHLAELRRADVKELSSLTPASDTPATLSR